MPLDLCKGLAASRTISNDIFYLQLINVAFLTRHKFCNIQALFLLDNNALKHLILLHYHHINMSTTYIVHIWS